MNNRRHAIEVDVTFTFTYFAYDWWTSSPSMMWIIRFVLGWYARIATGSACPWVLALSYSWMPFTTFKAFMDLAFGDGWFVIRIIWVLIAVEWIAGWLTIDYLHGCCLRIVLSLSITVIYSLHGSGESVISTLFSNNCFWVSFEYYLPGL